MTPEGKVKRDIAKILKRPGVWYFMPVAGRFGKKGIPDFVGLANGYFFAIEAKANAKEPTGLQWDVMHAIDDCLGMTLVVDETNLDSLKRMIELLLNR